MDSSLLDIKFSPFVDGFCDVEDQLPRYLLQKAEAYFARERAEKDDLTSREAVEKRKKMVREYFLNAIGGLPKKTPLNPRVRGMVEKEDYKIEKVIYESLPKFYVTSLLYVPKKIEGKAPAILFLCGHSKPAKSSPIYQKACIDLVKNGFVVLIIDPLGQGERLQYWDPKSKSETVRWGTTTHSYIGFQCSLIGDNVARYFVWDGIRGIDFLISRREVDEERIGVTGSSGGGTQTSYLMMVDPRIKAAVPCCFLTSMEMLIKTIGPQDAEQNIFGAIKAGINHDDYITVFAPKPVLIAAAAYDFFPIEGVLQTFERARRIYRLYDAEENVALHVERHGHGFSDELREAAVNWFKIHLKSEPPDFKISERVVESEESLNVTDSGQIIGELPEAKTAFDLNLERWSEKKPSRPVIRDEDELKQYVSRIRMELKTLLNIEETRKPIYPRIIKRRKLDDLEIEKIFFFSEPEIAITAMMIYAEGVDDESPPIIVLFENGTNDIAVKSDLIRELVAKRSKALVLDVRGIGGVKTRALNPYGTEFELVYTAYLLGTSLMGMRTFDVLRGIEYLRSREDVDFSRLQLYAKGQSAIYGLFVAVLNPEVKEITLEDMFYSYEDLIKTKIYKGGAELKGADNASNFERILINGMLEHFDIVDLLPSLHGRKYKFINLRNAKQEIVSRDEIEEGWFKIIDENYPILGDLRKSVEFK